MGSVAGTNGKACESCPGTCCKADDVPPVELIAASGPVPLNLPDGEQDPGPADQVDPGPESPDQEGQAGEKTEKSNNNNRSFTFLFATDYEVLRGISMSASLFSWGKLWMKSPIALPEDARASLWNRSVPIDKLDIFLSHTWHTPGSQKVRALFVQSGGYFFMAGWFLGTAIFIVLEGFSVVSEEFFYQRKPSPRLGGCVGSILGLLLSPYLQRSCGCRGRGGSKMCFLDVVCIHQTDEELMMRGIYGLGGFLAASSEMRILWSPPYLSRLWCVFELAAFRTANPSGRIVLKPVFVEVGLLFIILANYFLLLADEIKMGFGSNGIYEEATLVNQLITLLAQMAYFPLLHRLRQLSHEKRKLIDQMRHFELAKVSCQIPSDRDFIHASICQWYGSEMAFEEYVRGPLADELTRPFLRTDFPAVYWMMAISPIVSMGLDFWLNEFLRKSIDPYQPFLIWVVATPLIFMNSLHFSFILCDCCGPSAGILDYGKTFLLWLVLLGCNFLVFQQAILLYDFGLWGPIGASVVHVAISLLLRWVTRR